MTSSAPPRLPVFPSARPEGDFLLLATGSVSINLLSLALPIMTLQIYDRILPQMGTGTLPMLIAGVCIAIAIETVLRLLRAWQLGWQGAVFEYRLSCQAMDHILEAPLPDMMRRGPGEHLHQMAAIGKLKEFNSDAFAMTLIDVAFIPVFIAFIAYVAGPLVFVPVAGLAVIVLLSILDGRRLRAYLHRRDQADNGRYNFLIETLGAIHTLKALTLEKPFQRRYEKLQEKSTRTNLVTANATADAFNTTAVATNAMVAATIFFGAMLALNHQITPGSLVATLLLTGRMTQMAQRGLVFWLKYQDAQLAAKKVSHLFDTGAAQKVRQKISPVSQGASPEVQGILQVENIHYRAPFPEAPSLDVPRLSARPGDIVWISGADGSGKTTLLRLLGGILTPLKGTIRVDGQDISLYNPADLARHVGYIDAVPVIFRGTIRHNITRFGDIDQVSARRVAARLGIDKDVARLPLGFDTFLQGNISDAIPPGLKQRIAMARVMAGRPGILLLDHADASLDRHGQQFLAHYLQEISAQTTIVIVSEEDSLRHLATRHFHLRDGILTEETTPPIAP